MNVEKFIVKGIMSIKPEWLEFAVRNRISIYDYLFNHFSKYTKNKFVLPIIKTVLAENWEKIEYYLTDVRKIYDLLWKNPKLRPILRRRETIEYLNWAVKDTYKKLYKLVFLE